jgi:vacuolar-type H+-ATPase subunit D/Vma8
MAVDMPLVHRVRTELDRLNNELARLEGAIRDTTARLNALEREVWSECDD